jgi:hypothetical protein
VFPLTALAASAITAGLVAYAETEAAATATMVSLASRARLVNARCRVTFQDALDQIRLRPPQS